MESGISGIFCGQGDAEPVYSEYFKGIRLRLRLRLPHGADAGGFTGV